jgi:hypothetical protein
MMLALLGRAASAEQVIVMNVDSYDQKLLSLDKGERADVVVYLKSSGEPLNGFHVVLRKSGSGKISDVVSDNSGTIYFRDLGAGVYRLHLQPQPGMGESVAIGDFQVKYSRERYGKR